ncbi:predicted protein [Nematostella vectensis]|uniref:Uncharacterized protein n=1 Tax=Nematostella vectensis TaxID=45351 RepID=A7SDB2_NEMVE|nr:predicted protein [Nematostella vectensis]|eukprot:XP_001630340.1 predicted protein [Nematostella vectensis]
MMYRSFFVVVLLLVCFSDAFQWTKQPLGVAQTVGSRLLLEWDYSLTPDEAISARSFALLIFEKEKTTGSRQWTAVAAKNVNDDSVSAIDPRASVSGRATLAVNRTDMTDDTNYRCTFLSTFATPESKVPVHIRAVPNPTQVIPPSRIPPRFPSACDFERSTCIWRNVYGDDFDWTRHRGTTGSYGTGPSGDHTTGSGYYMYTETSLRNPNDTAILRASLRSNTTLNQCLTFWYHMYGSGMGTLRVKINGVTRWQRSGSQGNYWRFQEILYSVFGYYDIEFQGIRGNDFTSDIAIDDLRSSCTQVPPEISYISPSAKVREGQRFVLRCQVIPKNSSSEVYWTRNGERLDNLTRTNDSVIYTQIAEPSMAGTYVCVASSIYGEDRNSTILIVLYAPVKVNVHFNTTSRDTAVHGESVTVTCSSQAYPAARCKVSHVSSGVSGSSGELVIPSYTEMNQGMYECLCSNIYGFLSGYGKLTTYGDVTIFNPPINKTINEEGDVSFTCNATSTLVGSWPLNTKITWKNLPNHGKQIGSGPVLTLKNVTQQQGGKYECEAENGVGLPDRASAYLTVHYKPISTRFEASYNFNSKDTVATLKCSAQALPEPQYRIYRNGTLLSVGNGTLIVRNGSDYLYFNCTPFNSLGDGPTKTLVLSMGKNVDLLRNTDRLDLM